MRPVRDGNGSGLIRPESLGLSMVGRLYDTDNDFYFGVSIPGAEGLLSWVKVCGFQNLIRFCQEPRKGWNSAEHNMQYGPVVSKERAKFNSRMR